MSGYFRWVDGVVAPWVYSSKHASKSPHAGPNHWLMHKTKFGACTRVGLVHAPKLWFYQPKTGVVHAPNPVWCMHHSWLGAWHVFRNPWVFQQTRCTKHSLVHAPNPLLCMHQTRFCACTKCIFVSHPLTYFTG